MNVQIEQYLDLEIQLKRNLESHNNCFLSILSTDRRAPSRGTNLLPSLFNCLVKIKNILAAICLAFSFKSWLVN